MGNNLTPLEKDKFAEKKIEVQMLERLYESREKRDVIKSQNACPIPWQSLKCLLSTLCLVQEFSLGRTSLWLICGYFHLNKTYLHSLSQAFPQSCLLRVQTLSVNNPYYRSQLHPLLTKHLNTYYLSYNLLFLNLIVSYYFITQNVYVQSNVKKFSGEV